MCIPIEVTPSGVTFFMYVEVFGHDSGEEAQALRLYRDEHQPVRIGITTSIAIRMTMVANIRNPRDDHHLHNHAGQSTP
ncbi:hypothetical protein [Chitinophaga sp. sic0106]|uniref:hypothetical protein n=1 Tax=Chitinophaga sp. sic0106 TaxID=2854785 RepID=UPI001C43F589|nr:hypothetical protein [Chitinophaga sp. sic0106]MBV7531185.1 hypothetical protein [Chitinophaga sp. sic0106]